MRWLLMRPAPNVGFRSKHFEGVGSETRTEQLPPPGRSLQCEPAAVGLANAGARLGLRSLLRSCFHLPVLLARCIHRN